MSEPLPCVILAGGKGTRLSEETYAIPKPMLDVGGKPMLQHIIDIYVMQGVWNFYVPVGYKKEIVLGYFMTHPKLLYFTYDHQGHTEFQIDGYKVTVVDTGIETLTGGRLWYLRNLISTPFHFTYGDGLGNVDVRAVQWWHKHHPNELVTMTLVHPEGRFGRAVTNKMNKVLMFGEKVESESDWINGGFSILHPRIFTGVEVAGQYACNLEKDLYPLVAKFGFMGAMHHKGFWKCVDTLRDLEELRHIYDTEGAKWLRL